MSFCDKKHFQHIESYKIGTSKLNVVRTMNKRGMTIVWSFWSIVWCLYVEFNSIFFVNCVMFGLATCSMDWDRGLIDWLIDWLVLNATFSTVVLFCGGQFFYSILVEEAGVPRENHKNSVAKLTILLNYDWSRAHLSLARCKLTTSVLTG